MIKTIGIIDLHKSFEKGIQNIFQIGCLVVLTGCVIEIFNFSSVDKFILYINIPTILIIVLSLSLYYFNKTYYKIGFSILIYTILVNIFIGTYITTTDILNPARIHFFLRDTLFILLLLTVAAFSLHKIHSLIIGAGFLINCLIFAYYIKSSFLHENIVVILIVIIAYIGLVYYLVGMFERALIDQHEKYLYIQEQNEILNETNALLKERQQIIEEQSVELMVQKQVLLKNNKDLNELNATKDKFFSIIAHDIKNPFTAIMGFSELLLLNYRNWTEGKKIATIKLMSESSRNLYELLENLLQWSRSQRGLLEFSPVKIELRTTVEGILNLMKHSAVEKEIELKINIPEEKIMLNADPRLLEIILRNLISNSIKFTNKGGLIEIKGEVIDRFGIISVTDNGIGIPSKDIDLLFRIDVHNTNLGTNEEKGTGLGLILVKEFVTKQGGEIWVESEVGKGTIFKFTLPLL